MLRKNVRTAEACSQTEEGYSCHEHFSFPPFLPEGGGNMMLKAGLLTRSVFCLAFPIRNSGSVALVYQKTPTCRWEIELTAAGTVSDFHGIPILIRHIRRGWSGT